MFRFIRGRKKASKKTHSTNNVSQHGATESSAKNSTTHSAVVLQFNSKHACPQVKRLQGQRFLATEAPLIPLPHCNSQQKCECRYLHYADRRVDFRRDSDLGLPSRPIEQERRKQKDRRSVSAI